jgi:Histidine kinase-, DNA gyrase B-, and HSP90-like ATPase
MDPSIPELPEELRSTLERIRLATEQKKRCVKSDHDIDSAGAPHPGDRILSTLKEWLLDDEQKQTLALEAQNLFYLYAAAYLCEAGLVEEVQKQWLVLGIASQRQAEILTGVCRAAVGESLDNPGLRVDDPADDIESTLNLPLIVAGIQLARALDLKSKKTLHLIQRCIPDGRSYGPSNLAASFDVLAMGAHPFFPGTIQVKIHCCDPEIHRALKHHERTIQRVLQQLNARVNPRFLFSDVIYEIEADGYTPVDMKFVVDSSAALQLFTGNRLYDDKRTFLRELIQNAIDACHLRKMIDPDYEPEIAFAFNKDISVVTIRDNGIGMDRQWLEKYFLKIGISFYQSDEIRRINRDARIDVNFISQFGIGFLSSFLVADKIVIRTRKPPARGLMITITNLRDYFDVRFIDDQAPAGTEVALHLKPSRINYCRSLEFVGYLKTNIRFLKVPVRLTDETGGTTLIGMEQLAYERDEKRGVDFVTSLDFASSEGYLLLKAKKQTDYIQAVESAHGGVAVFQDGIFVVQLDDLLPEGARQNVIGRINLLGRERCELSMDRNRIFWTKDQLGTIKRRIRHGLVAVVGQFMTAVDGQAMPESTRTSIINHLAIFFDFNTVDDAMYDRIPGPIRTIIDKRFRDFIRVHYAHSHRSERLPGGDEYGQRWQQRVLASLMRKAG